ncbi:MAG: hypothetical protein ACOVKN_07355, partial [Arenimonas sp.]
MVKQILNNPVVRGLWIAFLLLVALATVFGLYSYSEHQVDAANDRLIQSNALASELLLTSETATRLARTYAMTGNRNFLDAYQQVMDSKNGLLAVPIQASLYYWNPSPGLKARLSIKKESLESRMQKLALRQSDIDFLKRASNLSESMLATESEVFSQIDAIAHDFSISHHPAMDLLFDDRYRRDKALILWNIHEFSERITSYEQKNVVRAKQQTDQLRYLFIFIA